MTVRTRFAPSPTGSLHIGNVRSGLFAYLYARPQSGHIHSAHRRHRSRALDQGVARRDSGRISNGSGWNGTKARPIRDYFRDRIEWSVIARRRCQLLRERKAYPCYCTAEELDAKRKAAEREHRKPVYDRKCRGLDLPPDIALPDRIGRPQLYDPIRDRRSTARRSSTIWCSGRTVFQNRELDDSHHRALGRLARHTTSPHARRRRYHMTHIVRGDDHVLEYSAADADGVRARVYAAGVRASAAGDGPRRLASCRKRHGATSVARIARRDYFPEALLNYLARLGWSHGDQEIFSKDELDRVFRFRRRAANRRRFQRREIAVAEFSLPEGAADRATGRARSSRSSPARIGRFRATTRGSKRWCATLHERAKTLVELVDFAAFYLNDEIEIDAKAAAKFLKPEIAEPLRALADELDAIERRVHRGVDSSRLRGGAGAIQHQARTARAAGARRAYRRHRQSRHLRGDRGARQAPHRRAASNAAVASNLARLTVTSMRPASSDKDLSDSSPG